MLKADVNGKSINENKNLTCLLQVRFLLVLTSTANKKAVSQSIERQPSYFIKQINKDTQSVIKTEFIFYYKNVHIFQSMPFARGKGKAIR